MTLPNPPPSGSAHRTRRNLLAALGPAFVVALVELGFKLQRLARARFDAPLDLSARALLLGSELLFLLGLCLIAYACALGLGRPATRL